MTAVSTPPADPVLSLIVALLNSVDARLVVIANQMGVLMSDQSALDASLTGLSSQVDAAVSAMDRIEQALAAAKSAGAAVPDLTAEIAIVNGLHDRLAGATSTADTASPAPAAPPADQPPADQPPVQ